MIRPLKDHYLEYYHHVKTFLRPDIIYKREIISSQLTLQSIHKLTMTVSWFSFNAKELKINNL